MLRPGFEPGTPRSKRGMMSVSPPKQRRRGRDSNPHAPCRGDRFSKATRPSRIRLPSVWPSRATEQGCSGRDCREQIGFRWRARGTGRTPVGRTFVRTRDRRAQTDRVDPPGVEPGLPVCHTDVIPPRPRAHDLRSVEPQGVEPCRRACKAQLASARDPVSFASGPAGSRTPISRVRGGRLPVGLRPHRRRRVAPSDLGGSRTHTPRGSRLSTGSDYQIPARGQRSAVAQEGVEPSRLYGTGF